MCSACDVRLSYSITQLSLSPCCIFFFNDSTTTELYTLSLHDALPISEADAVDADRPGIDLSPLHQVVQRRARRVLEVVRGQADTPQIALRVPRTVEREHMHAPLMGGVEQRMRPGFLEGVTARNVEDERRGDPIGAETQVAGDQRPVPGNVDVLDSVGSEGDHLLVAAADARIEIARLGAVLEDDVLGAGVLDGGLEVEVECCLRVAGGRLGLRQRLQSSRLQSEVLADHVVAAHASRQATPLLALEMEDLAGLLDQIVQHPLLTIPRERRPAADRCLYACHANDPPLSPGRVPDPCSRPDRALSS